MADLSRLRDPLEIAAASTDPIVRKMALRRKEITIEMARLDSFFTTYAEEKTDSSVAAAAESKTKIGSNLRSKIVIQRLKDILVEHGPLNLDRLHAKYCESHPDDSTRNKEALRVVIASWGNSSISYLKWIGAIGRSACN